MPQHSRHALLALALLTLLLLAPTHANALPASATLRTTDHAATPSLFSKLWDLLSAVWTTGSILEPNGANSAPGTGTNGATTGDNGSILEPNG